jgi:hypothetical protein
MKVRIVLLTVLGGMALIVIVSTAYTRRVTQSTQPTPTVGHSIQAQAAQARAKGKSEVVISAPTIEYTGSSASTDLDKALAYYTALVARPIKMQSYIAENGEDIVTWYKFKVVEMLSENKKLACPACPVPTPPQDFSQVTGDEFALVQIGGTVKVDGVKVTMTDDSFPQFESGSKYLLFISRYPTGVATLGIGPKGVFSVDDNGDVKGVNKVPHALKNDIEGRFNKSLYNLKQHAHSVKARH